MLMHVVDSFLLKHMQRDIEAKIFMQKPTYITSSEEELKVVLSTDDSTEELSEMLGTVDFSEGKRECELQ